MNAGSRAALDAAILRLEKACDVIDRHPALEGLSLTQSSSVAIHVLVARDHAKFCRQLADLGEAPTERHLRIVK